MDFQNGLDLLVFEKLGMKQYSSSGASGTLYAYDQAGGDVLIKGQDASGKTISVMIDDPNNSLTAASFSSADFILS